MEQLLGTTFTAFGISIILSFLMGVEYTLTGTIAALISGSFWAGGQYLQFQAPCDWGSVKSDAIIKRDTIAVYVTRFWHPSP